MQEKRKIQVLAKTSTDKEQICSKLEKGAKLFEIQLLKDKFDIQQIYDNICNIKVFSIHTPLIYENENFWEEMCISDLYSSKVLKVFERVCKLAQKVAVGQGHNVIVVLHCDICIYEMKKYKMYYIYEIINSILMLFPNVEICLENISPIRTNPFRYNNGAMFGAAEIAEDIKNVLKTERIGTVLDICHMQMMQYMLNCFSDSEISLTFPKYNMRSFFEKYAATLKLVHLNEADEDGYGNKHGKVPKIETIRDVLRCCLDINNMPAFCLEVKEKDYFKSDNYVKALNNFKIARGEIVL